MTTVCSISELVPVILEVLAKGGSFSFIPNGTSMLPTVTGGRDRVTLAPLPERIKNGDIVLFKTDGGDIVLHRVICQKNGLFTFCGDNLRLPEQNIPKSHLIGRVTEIERNGKKLSLLSPTQRLCAFFTVLEKRCIFLLRRLLRQD